MPEQRVERKLVAILAADVAGYSRLVGLDEEGTLARLKSLRQELIDPEIASHRGRIVKTTGDGLLVEFGSVVDAVRCAVAVQRACVESEAALPQDRRIEFRIGINLGDIVVEGDDILGDGVNIAARLEGIAESGGICISGVVHDQVRGKVEVEFADLGEQNLKNIAQPVRAYRVLTDKATTAASPAPLPLPDKPSIAVLAFQNMSGDPEQEYFADGMVEEIITALSRIRWLFVIARNSSFTYKGKPIDVKQVGRELGVRYVLEGSVRKSGNRVRITGQLIDTTMGAHIWADRFDGSLDDIFELQDSVASSVVGAIEPKLRFAEIARAARKPTERLDAYDLYLRALAQTYRYSGEGFDEAVTLLQRALVLDPSYAPAAAMLSFCRAQQQTQGWGALSDKDREEAVRLARHAVWLGVSVEDQDRDEAIRLARHAIASGRDDSETLWQAAWPLYRFAGETEMAMALIDRAIALNPNAVNAWMIKGWIHANNNQPEPAIEAFSRAPRLCPFGPTNFFTTAGLAYAHLAARRFEDAIEWADHSLHDNPRFVMSVQAKIIANAHLGRLDEARAELAQLRAIAPNLTIARYQSGVFSRMAPEFLELRAAGLRLAGLPEA